MRRKVLPPIPGSGLPSGINADRKSTRLNSSHLVISYAVFCLKKKKHDRDKNQLQIGQYHHAEFELIYVGEDNQLTDESVRVDFLEASVLVPVSHSTSDNIDLC